ncbi:retrovirus-related Pol polyprotein from transposon opus [Trichonephila clavipes]|nr:retrovirus-related Pol polyprotein from transposon opus [Trichonephila clavipes]
MKKFCESCKECQLTRSVRIKDRSSSTPVARPELPFEVGNMDLIGPIDPPSLRGHKYILRLVDQHTRWGEAVPLTSLSAKELSLEQSSRLLTVAIIVCSVCGFSVSRFVNFLFLVSDMVKSATRQILLLGGACKNSCLHPGKQVEGETMDIEKGSGNDGGEKVGTGEKREGDEKSWGREK